MRALTIVPGQPLSVRLSVVPEPAAEHGTVLVEAIALGICGTDREMVSGHYGWPPPGRDRLIIGHESIGRVLEAPADADLAVGDLVVGIVRHPDPVPCSYCAIGEWDMCSNGLYTEHGIKELDGFGAERFRLEPEFAVKIDPSLDWLGVLIEPTSVVAKAWDEIDRIGGRSPAWHPRTVLVTGAGPIGLLAALIGRQRGLEVHVLDRVTSGVKPSLVRDLGAIYHVGLDALASDQLFDVILECTGATTIFAAMLGRVARSGIVCLTGVSSPGHLSPLDLGQVNRDFVLGSRLVVGSVNANRAHYRTAATVLSRADRRWLARLVTRRVALDDWQDALAMDADDVKVVLNYS
jgi:threonine dehydrogenase-like Zn-dependent dehydrogenase